MEKTNSVKLCKYFPKLGPGVFLRSGKKKVLAVDLWIHYPAITVLPLFVPQTSISNETPLTFRRENFMFEVGIEEADWAS